MKVHYSYSMWVRWILLVALLVSFGNGVAPLVALGGDEDQKKETPEAPREEPAPTPIPEEPEAPDLSLSEEPETSPEFTPLEEELPAAPVKRRGRRPPHDPDKNVDYSEIIGMTEPGGSSRGVLPPALGVRGYRHNLVAVSFGDKTPGYGAILEYSWNRLAVGAFFAFRPLRSSDRFSYHQTIGGAYLGYRWLPWDISPVMHAGLELGSETSEAFGGLTGLGVEARVYYGWTLLLGYTYHSTVRKGFWGGGFGWIF